MSYAADKLQRLFDGSSDNPAISYFLRALDGNEVAYFKKVGEIKATKALVETSVVTTIDGEQETTNTANIGDYIVTGAAGEQYVLTADKLESRYKHKGGDTYIATGGCYAVQYEGASFTFKAPWGEYMICNSGDYICSTVTNGDDVYRIEQSVFNKTYHKIGQS